MKRIGFIGVLVLAGCIGTPQVSSVEIREDTNDDGLLNPGERASLAIGVSGLRSSASGRLSTSSPDVSVERETSYLSSSQGLHVGAFVVEVAPGAALADADFTVTVDGLDLPFSHPIETTRAAPVVGAVTITDDTNGDAVLSKGESASLSIRLDNVGSSAIPDPHATLTSPDERIVVTRDAVSYRDIAAGEDDAGYGTFTIEIADTTPAGTAVALNLRLVDELENVWDVPVPIEILPTGAQLAFARFSVADDDDGDGLLEAGEDARLSVVLRNVGSARALGARAILSTSDPRVTVTRDTVSYPDIDPSEEKAPYGSFQLALDPATPAGHSAELFLTITDDQANVWTVTVTLTEGGADTSLSLDSFALSEVGGNGDGIVNPSEIAQLAIVVANGGTAGATEVRGTLTTGDPNVRIEAGTVRVGNVGAGSTAPADGPFRFTILASHPGGMARFDLELAAGNARAVTTIDVPITR